MACPDVSRCDYACLRRGVCDHQSVWKASMDWAATLAVSAFDDRCRMRSQNLDWDEGFHAGTQAAAKAIRAALTASPAGDDPKALDAVARADEIERVYDYLQVRDEALGVDTDEVERKVSAEEIVAVARQIRDAEARSSSTEAVEQEVERLRHLAQSRYEFMREMASELEAYGAKGWIAKVEAMARPSPVPAACKPEGDL